VFDACPETSSVFCAGYLGDVNGPVCSDIQPLPPSSAVFQRDQMLVGCLLLCWEVFSLLDSLGSFPINTAVEGVELPA